MCIVIAKPKGADIPSMSEIQTCWNNNPDGAGIMYLAPDNQVIIRKGFMTLESYIEALGKLAFTADDTVVYHFRIATAGSITQANTHPFPASKKVEHLQALDFAAHCGIAHNGILNYNADTEHDLSDTMTFIRDIFHDKLIRHDMDNKAIKNMLAPVIGGSKMAIMEKGKITLIGHFIEVSNRFYSNNGYKELSPYALWVEEETNMLEELGICVSCYADVPEGAGYCPVCGGKAGQALSMDDYRRPYDEYLY